MARKKSSTAKKPNPHIGSSLDEFLDEYGLLEQTRALAIKEVIAWQLRRAMKTKMISKSRMAKLMGTSRTQIEHLLNPSDGNVTLTSLSRAAAVVGRRLSIDLV